MNWADWVVIGVLTLSSVISLARGFVKEAFSLVIWLCAFVAANTFSYLAEAYLISVIDTPSVRTMSAFALVFVGVLLIGALINVGIGLLVKASGLSTADRLLGMFFGFSRGLLIVMSILIYVPAYIPIKKDLWYQQSILLPHLAPYEPSVKNVLENISQWVLQLTTQPLGQPKH